MANVVFAIHEVVAHINPTIGIAKELEERGHSVVYISHSLRFRSYLKSIGLSHYYVDLGLSSVKSSKTGLLLKWLSECFKLPIRKGWKTITKALLDGSSLRRMVKDLSPDLIIFDSMMPIVGPPLMALKVPLAMISAVLPAQRERNVPPLTSNFIPRSPGSAP